MYFLKQLEQNFKTLKCFHSLLLFFIERTKYLFKKKSNLTKTKNCKLFETGANHTTLTNNYD
jgi:hypothetical protein